MASLMCPSATVRAGGGGACELSTPVGEGGGLPPTAVAAVDDAVNDELLVKVHLLFHRAFRSEMDGIVQDALKLERMHAAEGAREPSAASGAESAIPFLYPSAAREGREGGEALAAALENLRNRYNFLYKCYKFHSHAEDQVRRTLALSSVQPSGAFPADAHTTAGARRWCFPRSSAECATWCARTAWSMSRRCSLTVTPTASLTLWPS